MPVKPTMGFCNKCGKEKELLLDDCVCAGCSDVLDKKWAGSAATDWVLITTATTNPVEDVMHALKAGLEKKGIPFAKELAIPGPVTPGPLIRYLHRNTTYGQMKSSWAMGRSHAMSIGAATPEDIREIKPNGLTWPNCLDGTFIRPASVQEIAEHDRQLRRAQAYDVIAETFEKWGFDDEGEPLDEVWEESDDERKTRANEEIDKRLEQLGLLREVLADWGSGEAELKTRLADKTIRKRPEADQQHGLSQVAGMADLKEQLLHEVIGPFRQPDLFRRYRVSLPNGILFYGPPGCGKTYIARRLAEELGWSFQYCRPSDVASPYIHDTVRRIRELFSTANENAPSIIFIDEFEAFVPARSEMGSHQQYKAEEVNEFLSNLEGCAESKVLVIAATNEPEKIDPAVRRSGRFDKLILIPPPDAEARRAMLEFHLNDRPVAESLDTAGIAAVLDGYSASDIKLLVDEAARMALKRIEPISAGTLLTALERVPASITKDDMQRYSAFRSRGSSSG